MAAINPATATVATVNDLLQKLGDSDPDFRFMSLNDLLLVLTNGRPEILLNDYNTAARTIDHLVRALDDQNGEVQNLAIKCLGPLVHRLPLAIVATLMEKLTALRLKNSVDNTVPAMALKAVVLALPAPTPGETPTRENVDAYSTVNRVLVPRFIGLQTSAKATTSGRSSSHHQRQVAAAHTSGGATSESILDINANPTAESVDVLIEVVRCFGPMLQPFEVEALQEAVFNVLHSSRASSAVKKRAVAAASILAVYLSEDALTNVITLIVQALNKNNPATQRLYISILGSMARSIPLRFGRHIGEVVPFILNALNEEELEKQLEAISDGNDPSDFNDVREAALVALDAFLSSCPNQMRPFTEDAIQACLRYIKYDPNYLDDDDDMDDADEDDGFGVDENDDEFDADAGFDDDDDASWKVRRCAAKAVHTLILTRSSGDLLDNGVLYREAAPLLIKRFEEREETVRLEVISAVSLLVRKTGEGVIPEFTLDSLDPQTEPSTQPPLSRKRRRQSSVAGANVHQNSAAGDTLSPTLERRLSIPTSGPRADLAEQTGAIVMACSKLLKGKQVPSKQAAINLLNDIVAVQRGGLTDYFEHLFDLVLETIKSTSALAGSSSLSMGGGNASATPTTLRIAALRLVGYIANTHSSQALQPYLPHVVDAVLSAVSDRFYKLSAEAIAASEEVVKSITLPRVRTAAAAAKFKPEINKLYDVLTDRATASSIDAEVRQKAIQALGTLLSRSAVEGNILLALDKRNSALGSLLELLSNETLRLSAVRAIDIIAASTSKAVPFDEQWTRSVAVHLSAQLGKANHSLRGSCVHALRHLVQSPAAEGELDDKTISVLVAALYPVISRNDQRLLNPSLRILKVLVEANPALVVSPEVIQSICALLQTSGAAAVLDPLLQLATVIGRSGHGQQLMKGLLQDVGVAGDPAIVGKLVGNLLVASGDSAGVTIDSFVKETQTFKADQVRASLALSVLGEAGLRLGKDSPIKPELFLEQFTSDYDKVSIAAAVALGRAGAGNVPQYLPVILQGLTAKNGTQYLLLQSVKEVLQQVTTDHTDISEYTADIWDELLQVAEVENNKAVCAECMGRLAITAPETYIGKLRGLLDDQSPALRAISVQAIRYALPDTGEAFDAILREHLVAMLNKALVDKDMEIRRLAMTALNSAANNKPELILSHLSELLPHIMEESKPKPELVREVMMGPFKHLVDDGLEVRKGAYETLYALMESAFSRISTLSLFDRVIAGLGDEHDIRAMCTLMVSRLAYIAPEETTRHLDSIAEKFRATLSTKLKDNAVKQEHEKQEDANKSVLRATLLLADRLKVALNDGSPTVDVGAHQTWLQYWEWANRSFDAQLRVLRSENRDRGAAY